MKTFFTLVFLSFLVSSSHAQYCSGLTQLTECSGSFDDGSGSSNYNDNTTCYWLIQVPEDSTILLTFTSFNTESCCDDLRIYNGSSSNAPLIGEYAGNQIPNPIVSATNELYLEFDTDGSVSYDGWSIAYSCNNISFIDLSYVNPGFSSLFNTSGSIMDYNFDIRNNGNLDSGSFDVGFYASQDSEINPSDQLIFTTVIGNLPANSSINLSDVIDIRDSIPPGEYQNVGFIIDPQNTIEELTEFNNTYIDLYESIYIPYCSDLTTIVGCDGILSDGSGFEDVVRQTQCSWLIQSENDETIYLDFINVDLSYSDIIRVYNGLDENAPLIKEFRGNENFYPVVSSGNALFFEFDASYSNYEGWNAEYFCTDTAISNLILEPTSYANSIGSTVNYDLNISNNGNITSPTTTIYFFGSLDNNFNINQDFLMDSIELASIPPLGQVEVTYSLDARDILPSGSYQPFAIIDAFNQVPELNENDNSGIFTNDFYIPYCPDTTNVLEGCSGVLSDGSGNQNYTPSTDCSWLLKAETGQFVSLDLISADLGSSSTRLRLYDGANVFSPLIAEFAGNSEDEIPSTIISTGEDLYVEFETNQSYTYGSGWSFQYECTEDIGVNFEFTEDYNTINSYNNEIEYNVDIKNFGNGITPQTKIYFFLSADLVLNSNDIVLDSINLPSLQPYQSITINNSFVPQHPDITGGNFYAGFIIDPLNDVVELNEEDNYLIDYSIISIPYCYDETIIDDCFGIFDDGSGASNYAKNSYCKWLIEGPTGATIRLTFTKFDTESCCDDVFIYDGNSNNAPLIASYSGSSLPPVIETTQSDAYIVFDSDGSSERNGWEIEYECIDYFSNLQFKDGTTQFQIVNNIMNFSTIIENDGILPTGEFEIGFLLSDDETPNIGDHIITTKTVESINPDEELLEEIEINLNDLSIPSGEYFLIVRLDLGETIEENDEMDNDFISTFPIDIISNTETIFNETGIITHVQNHQLQIKNYNEHYLKNISLIKSDGVILMDQRINGYGSEYRFDVMNYPTGIYFVRIELDNQIVIKKVFIP